MAVYFSCAADVGTAGEPVYMRERPIRPVVGRKARLVSALEGYLRGPTAKESARGYLSATGDELAGTIAGVELTATEATINFIPEFEAIGSFATTQGDVFLAELSAVVFQIPGIDRLRLLVDGDCDRFWRHFESYCHPLERNR